MKTVRAALAVLALTSLALAACGDDDADESAEGADAGQPSAEDSPEAGDDTTTTAATDADDADGAGDADGDGGAEGDATGAGALFDQLPGEIQESGTLVFAGDSHPPYRTVEDDGSVTGIDPDFQAALEEELGVDIEVEIASGLPDILTGMLAGRYDAFNGPVRSTPEREADFDSIVWMTTRSSYVFLEENAADIPDSDALCGLEIAGVTGSVTETQVERLNEWCAAEGVEPATFTGLADTNATILAVESGRVDALATTETAALDIVDKTPDIYGYVTQSDEQGAGVDLMALLTPKGNGLGEVLLAAFENLFESGRYDELMDTWNLTSVSLDAPMYNPATS
ncbi:MAG: transporter substrate-binding domain-containing protein [Actinomycetota bacterium]|nr:transporter substrate-binding domain-containing protein [Actinomycetota bacterium]